MAGGVDLFNGSIDTLDMFRAAFPAAPFAGDIIALDRDVVSPLLDMAMRHKKTADGPKIVGDVLMTNPDNARTVLPGEERQYTITQNLAQWEMPWRKVTTYSSILEDEVRGALSSGLSMVGLGSPKGVIDRKIIDLKQAKEAGAMISFARELERQLLFAPASSSDAKHLSGFWGWVAKPTTAQVALSQTGGFYGWAPEYQDGTSFTKRANITVADGVDHENAAYANYTDVWEDDGDPLTEGDVQTLLRAKRRMGFEPPMTAKDYLEGRHGDLAMLTNETIFEAAQLKARANNDQLFADLGMYHGSVVIGGSPLSWVPLLDDDTDNPVLFVDWAHFFLMHPTGNIFHQIPARRLPNIPDAFVWDTDMVAQLVAGDIRRLGCVSKAV